MKTKKLLCVVLSVLVVISSLAVMSFASVSADEENYNTYEQYLESIKPENNYGLEDTVNEGKILQAWNWSYENATALMKTVAEQGFTTIQISPPNEIKMPTKGVAVCPAPVNGVAPNGWWMFYQPAGFQLNESEDNALGTKSEFVEMCAEAKKYGIKILVDAVINHMGTDDTHTAVYNNKSTNPMDHVNDRAQIFEPKLIAAQAFHSPWVEMTYKENYWDGYSDYDIEEDLTQHCTSGLPDLATETQLVQDTIYDYLEELILAGADGFRFDAAKHIETSHDTYFASDFWEDTLLKLRSNYPGVECYAYGEILNKCGDGRPFYEYTELMDVTDSSSYWGIKDAICSNGNSGNAIPYYNSEAEGTDPTTVNFTKENVIQWNESHDTYIDGGTSSLTVSQRNKIWAVTAARQTITGVYFARPDDRTGNGRAEIEKLCQEILLGEANLTSWTNPEVAAVNRFDNFFGDASEYNSVRDKVVMIERGGVGATLVNLSGTNKSVQLSTNILANGKYIDSITGNEFTVTDGTLKGQIGSTGIACIYYAEDKEPEFSFNVMNYIWNINVSNGEYPDIDGYYTVVFSTKWSNAGIYAWDDSLNAMQEWPGVTMKFSLVNDYGENQFVAYIPDNYTHFIINDNGGGQQTIDLVLNGNCGVYMSNMTEGKYNVGYWQPTFVPHEIPTESTETQPTETQPTETQPTETQPIETQPTETQPAETQPTETQPTETQPTETQPTETQPTYKMGDADGDNVVNVKDATAIQKVVAAIEVPTYNAAAADVDASGVVNVKDATAIQKWVAGIDTGFQIG